MIIDFGLTILTNVSGTVKVRLQYVFEFVDLIKFERDLLIFKMKFLLSVLNKFVLLSDLFLVVFHELCDHLFQLDHLFFHRVIEGK